MEDFFGDTMQMKKWAVVGASEDSSRFSYKIIKLMKERGYEVYPVNPKLESVLDLTCYASIEALPDTPDVVDMVVNPKVGLSAMEQIKERGIKYVWLQPGAESSEIREFADENGIEAESGCILAELRSRPSFRVD